MSYAASAPHPRLSVLSTTSLASSAEHLSPTASTRFSLPAKPREASGRSTGPNVYDRNLNKSRITEVSGSAFAFMFSEIVQYTQKRVGGIADLERKLNTLGYRVGTRAFELMTWRAEASSKVPKREIRFLPALMIVHTQVWRAVFGRPADAIEKSVENADEYMIIDNDPLIDRYISVPKDMSSLSCSSFTAGIVEAVMDGLGFTSIHVESPFFSSLSNRFCIESRTTPNDPPPPFPPEPFDLIFASFFMTTINTIHVSPALINTSCRWASSKEELQQLFDSPFTGAVTTRTATTNGFKESQENGVAFASSTPPTSINSYGYSPYPLSSYLRWIKEILLAAPSTSTKPFIVSITSSAPEDLEELIYSVQSLRKRFNDQNPDSNAKIAIELNTSCPNISGRAPPSYDFPSLLPLLMILSDAHKKDKSLTIGLKLPPYVWREQFDTVLDVLQKFSYCIETQDQEENEVEDWKNPIAFLTCTNTLGNSLLFGSQTTSAPANATEFALPNDSTLNLGGLAGASLHPLALGNVRTFATLLKTRPVDEGLGGIKIIGVGGVTDSDGVERMRKVGASVVGVATVLGTEGVKVFERLSGGEAQSD